MSCWNFFGFRPIVKANEIVDRDATIKDLPPNKEVVGSSKFELAVLIEQLLDVAPRN